VSGTGTQWCYAAYTEHLYFIIRSTGTEYALKVIDKSKCRGKEHMIESEVSILRRIHHPNIVQLVAEYDTHSELYLVMDLIKVSMITSALYCYFWLNIKVKDSNQVQDDHS